MSRPRHIRRGIAARVAVYSLHAERRPYVSMERAIELIKHDDAKEIKTASDPYAIQLKREDHFDPSKSASSPAGITCSEMQAAAEGRQRAIDKVNAWGSTTLRHNQPAMMICH